MKGILGLAVSGIFFLGAGGAFAQAPPGPGQCFDGATNGSGFSGCDDANKCATDTPTCAADDTGCVPDTADHEKCSAAVVKIFTNAIKCVIKCHCKQATALFNNKVFNEDFHWSLGDFLTNYEDQNGATVASAKPIGYYWRTSPADGFSGLGGFYDQLLPNNYTVEDASYAKLRELIFSYRLGPISGVGDWEVSFIGRNLFTITGYRGFDPEVGVGGGDAGTAAVNAVDAFTFPNLRTFSFAVATKF